MHGLLARHFAETYAEQYICYVTGHRNLHDHSDNLHVLAVDFSTDWAIETLPKEIDAVIHLAQSSNYRNFPNEALDVYKVNVDATAKLIDYAYKAGAERFIFASTGGLYAGGDSPCSEQTPILPIHELNYHFSSKLSGEALIAPYSSLMNIINIRPFFIYGPGQRRSMLMPRLYDFLASGAAIELQGENGIKINPIHVADASAVINAALSYEGSATFNMAGPGVLSIKEICQAMAKHIAVEPRFKFLQEKSRDLVADISLMKRLLHVPQKRFIDYVADVSI